MRDDNRANRVVAEPGAVVLRTVLDGGLEMPTCAKRVSLLDKQCDTIWSVKRRAAVRRG